MYKGEQHFKNVQNLKIYVELKIENIFTFMAKSQWKQFYT